MISHNEVLSPFLPSLRKGMWVMHQRRVAVVSDLTTAQHPIIVYVDAQGYALLTMRVPAVELRQAKYEEIPEPRRPSKERALELGY